MSDDAPRQPPATPARGIRIERDAEAVAPRAASWPGDWRGGWDRVWHDRRGRRLLILLGAVLAGYLLIWATVVRGLPDAKALLAYEPPLPTNVRGYDGAPIHSYARERRVQLAFNEYPKVLIDAVVSAEDKNFFTHGGVDYLGLANALFDNLTRVGSGQRARGASTITQQVAKNLLLTNEYSLVRKFKEAVLAYRIEQTLTKQQIMELYLNQIFLGRNSYGMQSAARAYFDKDVRDLTLPEAAYLGILPKAPSTYDPERRTERAMARRNYVLKEMLDNDFITRAEHDAAAAAPLGAVPRRAAAADAAAGDYFLEEVRRQLIDKFGETDKAGPNSVYSGGLWVRTSLDPLQQEAAQSALREGLLRYDRGRGWKGPAGRIEPGEGWQARFAAANIATTYKNWLTAVVLGTSGGRATLGFADGTTGVLPRDLALTQKKGVGTPAFDTLKPGDIIVVGPEGGSRFGLRIVPEISGGMVVQNPHTGQVLAMQGGFDARLESFNRATQALRQPGSTFKPFVYAAALDSGMTPASIIVDGPFCVYQGARLGQKCFRNFGGAGGAGPRTMRWGVEQSRNLMTVRAASQTGMDRIVKLAQTLGINPPGKIYPKVLAISLGAGDTTVQRLVNAYAILSNNGRELTPTAIDFVQDRRGKVILRADTRRCDGCNMKDWDGKPMPRPRPRGRQLMDAMTAYQMVHILEGVIERGTATTLRDLGRPIFGKTGTTSGPTNVWFVGGSADLTAGVYMGYDQPRDMAAYVQGGTVAAPIFKQWAQVVMKDMPVVPFRATAGVRMVRIERNSGRRVFGAFPTDNDPKAGIIWEAFKPESEPRRTVRRDDKALQAAKAEVKRPAQAGRQAQPTRADSDFLQSTGGIY